MRTRPGESGALLQDLLISVTNFFRDPECFAALESRIAHLFEGKSGADTIRVWVPGCATGEEAYSIAMLLTEHARTLPTPPALQVFGTDLDDTAIRFARDGIYPSAIVADVSEERLQRFFVKEHRGYRVRRDLRETVLFAVHDVLRDSPFSRVDLVSCRNLLIYLNREAQVRVLDTFHFALLPGGTLFLGSSETVDDTSENFAVADKKHRLYVQRHAPRIGLPIPMRSHTLALALEAQSSARAGPVVPASAIVRPAPESSRTLEVAGRVVTWSELHLTLLEQLAPPSVLVDTNHDILHMSASAGRYLALSGGEPTRNILRLIHPAVRIELRAALYHAANTQETATVPSVALQIGAEVVRLGVEVRAMHDAGQGLLAVFFHASVASDKFETPAPAVWPLPGADPVADQLDREVERLKFHLRETVEQYEASTEELKASNEELQAMNEELRSATEELETSREELQSINEELTTVNHELKSKVDELGHANSDMQNLMDATAIATVFLDRDLRITRYTPSAVALFNLISTDVGRPLSHLHTQLNYPQLVADATQVLDRLTPVERQVATSSGQSHLARLLPYRTLDDRIAGVVLTFVDISERMRDAEALRQSEERFSAIVSHAAVGVVQANLDGTITFVNQHYAQTLGYAPSDLLGTQLLDLVHPEDRAESATKMQLLPSSREQFQIEKRCLCKDQSVVWLHNSVSCLVDAGGQPAAAIIVSTDISERKRAEAALRRSTEWLRLIVENAVEYAIFSMDTERRITTWSSGAERLLGYSETEAVGQLGDMIFTPEDDAAGAPELEATTALTQGKATDDRQHQRKDGSRFWASGAMMAMQDASGATVGLLKILRDQSAQRASQQALERSRTELVKALGENENARVDLQAADAAKDRFLAVLSHELRNPLASISNASMAMCAGRLSSDENARASQIIKRQALVMKVLLNDLLDVSRLRLGKLVLHMHAVPLSTVVATAAESVRAIIDAAGHSLELRMPPQDIMLKADPVRLAQVLSNLLGNAAKYTPKGGKIILSAEADASRLQIVVEDNGIGIEPSELDAMFEMFTQSASGGARTESGLGIGLALVRNIVELHGGRAYGESAGVGKGCRFVVELPLHVQKAAPGPDGPAARHAPVVQDPAATPKAKSVLVVDDNTDVAWSIAQLLDEYDVTIVSSGAQALEILGSDKHFDAVVLDLGMPEMGGLEVAKAIRAQPWGEPLMLIAATGWGQDSDRRRSSEAGFNAHLVKPVDAGELKALIEAGKQVERGLVI